MSVDWLKRIAEGWDLELEEARAVLGRATPVVLLDDLQPPEAARQSRWRACIGGRYVGPVAGQYGMVQIRNYPGSGLMVVVDRIIVFAGAAGWVQAWEDVAGYATLGAEKTFRDQRLAGIPGAQMRYTNNAAHQGDTQTGVLGVGAYIPSVIEGPFILEGGAAGQAIGVEEAAVNVGLGVIFEWRERDYRPTR